MNTSNILVPLSVGELIDKISILKIKKKKITNKNKQKNIIKELKFLEKIYKSNIKKNKKLDRCEKQLIKINKILWEIEDEIRNCESKRDFKEIFIKLARSVYINNDKRSKIKREINTITGSNLIEEKSYKSY
jgi:hypothetical protein